MNFCFYSARTFESWDWSTPLETGIGGSETSHVEMAQRLARRGHLVTSFAPIPDESRAVGAVRLDGAVWYKCSAPDPFFDGWGDHVFVIYRDPPTVDKIPAGVPAWLICQDVSYPTMTPERAARFTRIVALCEDHAQYLKQLWPYAAEKVCISSNGIRSALIRKFWEHPGREHRNPKRLIYASSPDRGLWSLLHIFSRVRELIDDVELHVFYGFNNLEKCPDAFPNHPEKAKYIRMMNETLIEALKAPGIVHHGRIGQRDMIDEWLTSGIWCYPSTFTETSCITCMDAQACGAIPVTTPVWAVGENVRYGVMVEGFPDKDPLTKVRYVNEIVRLVQDPERQDAIRSEMMPWALNHFDWENFVTQWEGWAAEDLAKCEKGVAA